MTRVLVGDEWFEPLSSLSISESDFEQSILRYSEHLFPGYWCLPFTEIVDSPYGSSKADLALVDKRYRGWAVVEVELEHHSLARHVEPQMRRLSNGSYLEQHARALCRARSDLDPKSVELLVRSTQPDFIVVVPREEVEWKSTLSNMGIKLSVVQVFASRSGRRIVRQSGDRARVWEDGIVSRLLPSDGFAARGLRVESPGQIPPQDRVWIIADGQRTSWRVVRTKTQTYIFPDGRYEPGPSGSLALLVDNEGNFILKEVSEDD